MSRLSTSFSKISISNERSKFTRSKNERTSTSTISSEITFRPSQNSRTTTTI